MRLSLPTLFFVMSLAIVSCNPARPDGQMYLPAYKGHTLKYTHVDHPTRMITGILKDEVAGIPICFAIVELYTIDNRSTPLISTTTNSRGKFNFIARDGLYVIVISHKKYQEKEILVELHGWDVDLNDIKFSPFYD
ncbi:MAG: carboxypeptidase-like regulatory domain-containing protein [Chitinophagaceae bacterium]